MTQFRKSKPPANESDALSQPSLVQSLTFNVCKLVLFNTSTVTKFLVPCTSKDVKRLALWIIISDGFKSTKPSMFLIWATQ